MCCAQEPVAHGSVLYRTYPIQPCSHSVTQTLRSNELNLQPLGALPLVCMPHTKTRTLAQVNAYKMLHYGGM